MPDGLLARRYVERCGVDGIGCDASVPLDFMAQGSELEIVDSAGHFLHVERPEVVNLRILEFLKS